MKSSAFQNIAAHHPTPLYVFDLDEFDARIKWIQGVLGSSAELCYAIKANPFLLARADRSVRKFEVCSPGEFAICERARIAPEKIVYSGVYKDAASTENVIRHIAGAGTATVESPAQAGLLEECAGRAGKTLDVILRLTSGNQFGMDEETLTGIIRNREQYGHLRIRGFQMYTGTQKKKLRTIEKELGKLDALIRGCEEEYGFRTEELEYGPGLPVNYFEDDAFDEEGMLKTFASLLSRMAYRGHKCIEMGRFAASSCGYYLTAAADIKCSRGQNIIITDGGSHQMKYYGQNMGMRIPFFEQLRGGEDGFLVCAPAGTDSGKWDLYGALCTVHDIIVRALPLEAPKPGDIFIFKNTGAYSVTEGMALFLSRDLPPVLSYDRNDGIRILRGRISAAEFNYSQPDI